MPKKSELLDELTERVGFNGTIELLRAWGGRRLRVPKEIPADHPIAFAVGFEPAKKIAYFYGGTDLELPAERNALIQVRNDSILSDLAAGESVRSVAELYGLSPRMVRYIQGAAQPSEA